MKPVALLSCALTALALFGLAGRADADDEACGPPARAWAAACTVAGGGRVEAFRCPAGHIVFAVAVDEHPPVFVDATNTAPGLRQTQGVGLSPIGEFDDVRAAPQPVRDGFGRVAACVERDPSLPFGKPSGQEATVKRTGGSAPWRLVAGLVLAGLALTPRRRPCRLPLKTTALLAVLGASTFFLARALAGASFFHQNGHGPNWIAYALGEPCAYGPGFAELFGWAARLRPDHPESAVFACNGVLAATCPIGAWVVARRTGAGTSLAWAIAIALAIDPLFLRIAFTESYYVPYMALLLAATAVALSAPTLRSSSPRFLLACAATGLIAAEAARVHPVGWVAVAVVPLVHLACPGSPRRNLEHAAVAFVAVGAVVAAAAGPAILRVLAGEMGEHYLPEWRHGSTQEVSEWRHIAIAVVAAGEIGAALTWRWRGRWLVRVGLVGLVLVAATAGTSLLNVDVDWVRAAHSRMFLASGVGAGVGVVAPVLRRWVYGRVAVVLVVALGGANAADHWRWVTELPTDALELRLALVWRDSIPPSARLVAVETAGVMAVQMPIYPSQRDDRAPVVRLDVRGAPPSLRSFGDQVYYYRSSLCSTSLARAWCDALEQTAVLQPVDVHDLPARPSTQAVVYDAASVRVGLYRVGR